jgi:hypothetical protein
VMGSSVKAGQGQTSPIASRNLRGPPTAVPLPRRPGTSPRRYLAPLPRARGSRTSTRPATASPDPSLQNNRPVFDAGFADSRAGCPTLTSRGPSVRLPSLTRKPVVEWKSSCSDHPLALARARRQRHGGVGLIAN